MVDFMSSEKNALSILRNVADLHGGDLVFDCPNRLVHLLTVNGKDSGALFAYRKNMKSIQRVARSRLPRAWAVRKRPSHTLCALGTMWRFLPLPGNARGTA